MNKPQLKNEHTKIFDEIGRYILADFDHRRPFSSFLPGIAGLQGIPMWIFYVNRGQAVCSFGVQDKDHPIIEFQPANKAYQSTARTGFRTFFNGERRGEKWHREAFAPWVAQDAQRTMFIGMNEVEIQEINTALGFQVNVLYFMLPNEPFACLARKVSIKNLQDSPLSLEILDGLPGIVPYGVDDGALKNISRTIEAWMSVDNLKHKLPFYRLKATPGDTAEVHAIQSGNFALGLHNEERLTPIADPAVIFGLDMSHSEAHLFHDRGLAHLLQMPQILEGRTLCAFFGAKISLNPGEVKTLTGLYGYSQSLSKISASVETLGSPDYLDQKLVEARELTDDLTDVIQTNSASPIFDAYCRQTFLDNLLRGGIPIVLGGKHIVHVYSRKHGDIERDYNYFILPPEYYSQGNGNYRDVNQNRRNDVFFVPQAGEFNIRLFLSLIQPDGYNPLIIHGLTFSLLPDQVEVLSASANEPEKLTPILGQPFTPGQVFSAALAADLKIPVEQFIRQVFSQAEAHMQADHGEGFWVDHWTYNLDLIEAYLAIYPDRKAELLFESDPLPFFDISHRVQPRSERFVRRHGDLRQLNAVVDDPEKAVLIGSRHNDLNWARTDHGQGEIFRVSLISKLVLLALIKFATRDPSGMGIFMEAGKPGWYDALNGLPGLFGSSMPETYELQRLLNFLIHALDETPGDIKLPVEAQSLLEAVQTLPEIDTNTFMVWDRMSSALETYRESTRLGFNGETCVVNPKTHLKIMHEQVKNGITLAQSSTDDLPPTYFIHQVTDFELTGTQDLNGNPHIWVKGFKPVALPSFLEGPVHLMKIINTQEARELVETVKKSALFDREIEMYKVNTDLRDQPFEIGRARAFTPGWLENESIWMHMAFKYLLELQNAGLYEAFFEALEHHLPAFMDPDIYGRSPLENSSFIVSSAHPDASLHGNGFVARLSGSTAEFLSMWVFMTAGKQPFSLEEGQLLLQLKPALPGWLFKWDGTFTFRFLGSCDVTLHNPLRLNTYAEGVEVKQIELHSAAETIKLDGAKINSPYAERIRMGEFESMDLFY